MVLLIDTNVIIDFISKREPFYDDADAIFDYCSDDENTGLMALNSVTNVFYILRKMPDYLRRKKLNDVCLVLKVISVSHEQVVKAINEAEFKDFEDCIQSKCAESAKADYIITRNVQDFVHSAVPAVTPREFLTKYKN